jgi:hypothetical protein
MIPANQREEQRYRYRAYQLHIAASLPIPEMVTAEDADSSSAPDVVIATGDFPDQIPNPLSSSAIHQVNSQALLLRVAGVARYLVREGREILIDPDGAASAHDVRVYLLGTCLGALLHQRGFLVLHASGIATAQGCALFAGSSGAGKSTLLAELMGRGYKMVVDDVCAVRFDGGGKPIVVPSYPRTRLWADAAERFAIDTSVLPRTRPTWNKFERQVAHQFSDREAPLTHLFHLTGAHAGPEYTVERLGPIDAFTTLLANTYRGVLLDGLNRRGSHFQLASRAASAIEVIRVGRPAQSSGVAELAALILDHLSDS